MIPRPEPIRQVEASFQIHPVTALLGPRQCGKTTLARVIMGGFCAGAFYPLWVISPGDLKYALDSKITVIPFEEIPQLAKTGIVT